MPATQIVKSSRYFSPGTTRIYFCVSIANKSAPTRAELDAGTDLTREVAEVDGWNVSSGSIDTPDYNSRFVSKVPGRIEADDSSLTFYADKEGQDVRTLMPRDATGYAVFLWGGDVTGQPMDVFPIQVGSVPKQMPDNEAARLVVECFITDVPAENVSIPA